MGGALPVGGMGGAGGAIPVGGEGGAGGEPVGGEPVGGAPVGGMGGEGGAGGAGGEPVGGEGGAGGEPVGGVGGEGGAGGEPVGGMGGEGGAGGEPVGGEGGMGGAPFEGDPCEIRPLDDFGACPVTVPEIRGDVALDTLITVEGVVTAVRAGNDGQITNMAIQGADAGLSQGLWVYLGDNICADNCEIEQPSLGDAVSVTGTTGEFRTQRQVAQVANLSITGVNAGDVTPTSASIADAAVGGEGDALEGMLLSIEDATVSGVDAGAGNFTLTDGDASLLVDDFLLTFPSLPTEGQALPRVDGVLRVTEQGGARVFSLNPRLASDLDVGPLSVAASGPASVIAGAAFEVEVSLNQAAPAGGLTLDYTVEPAGAVAGPAEIVIAEGDTETIAAFTAGAQAQAGVTITVGESATVSLDVIEAGEAPVLQINELDYDQSGSDTGEFLEIYNAGASAVPLAGYVVETVNGSGNVVYGTYALADAGATLPAGGYLVIGVPAIINAVPEGVLTLEAATNFLQNGAPDGVRLVSDQGFVDGVAYEGNIAGVGEGDSLEGENGDDSYGRCTPDTNNNAADFTLGAPTPGAPNTCG